MKKAIIITVLFCGLLILTTCKDWYDDMNSFETVLTSGVWEVVEDYKQPNPETPKNMFSKYDILHQEPFDKTPIIKIFNTNGNYLSYILYPRYSDTYIVNNKTKDTLCSYLLPFEIYEKWSYKDDNLYTGIDSATFPQSILKYSDEIIEMVNYNYQYIYDKNTEPGQPIPIVDSVKIKHYTKYKNVKDNYTVHN